MLLRILLGASAVVLVAGCETSKPNHNNANNQIQKPVPKQSNSGTDYVSCNSGSIERAVIDIGSTGPELKVFCVVAIDNVKNLNGYKMLPPKSLEDLKVPEEKYTFDAVFKSELEKFPSRLNANTAQKTDICKDSMTSFPKFKKIIDFASTETNGGEIRAAATAAFRNSPNGPAYIRQLRKCFKNKNLKVQLISQRLEGELEFRGVVARIGEAKVMAKKVPIVWGHGSTSVQVTVFDKKKPKTVRAIEVIDAGDGAKLFCDWLLSERLNKQSVCPKGGTSHYPIKPDERSFAKRKERFVEKQISQNLKKLIKSGDGHAFAVGGSQKFIAIDPALKKPSYSIDNLRDAIKNALGKRPDELKKMPGFDPKRDPHEHAVSNLLLSEGVMKGVGISSVEYVKASLADGLAVVDYW